MCRQSGLTVRNNWQRTRRVAWSEISHFADGSWLRRSPDHWVLDIVRGGASLIAVVVPALNEADKLQVLLPRIPARLFGLPVQVIVVSDGCTDGTDEVAVGHGSILVRLPRHRGKGAALRAGFGRAMELDLSQLVTMDADGQHHPADLERLVQPVIAGECELAVGSRFLSDPSRGPAPLNRYLVRKVIVAALRAALGRTYTDPCCGYRCFSLRALQAIRLQGDRYQSELETLFEAASHGLKVVEVSVRGDYPPGSSKMGAQCGRLAGRAWVISQYVSTIARKTWELRGSGYSVTKDPRAGPGQDRVRDDEPESAR